MPLIDMDGKEKDYRETGGFVDMGRMERADDVPARLSKNEFVFTADAVRNAGEGDIDKGAEVMYNMMKNLEAGGEVSEESQGLEGARKMFQTSQRLEKYYNGNTRNYSKTRTICRKTRRRSSNTSNSPNGRTDSFNWSPRSWNHGSTNSTKF